MPHGEASFIEPRSVHLATPQRPSLQLNLRSQSEVALFRREYTLKILTRVYEYLAEPSSPFRAVWLMLGLVLP